MATSLKCTELEIIKLQKCKEVKPQLFFFNMAYSHHLILGLAIMPVKPRLLSLPIMDTMYGLETAEETSIQELREDLILINKKKNIMILVFRILESMIFLLKFNKLLMKVEDKK
jgi:hypothetical protein